MLATVPRSGLSPADWTQRLEAERRHLHPLRRQDLAREFEPLRQVYRQTTFCLRQCLNEPRLQQPELAPLARLGRQALELSRLLYDELCHVDLIDRPVVTAEPLRELAADWTACVERLDDQLWLVVQTHECAEALHAVCDEVTHTTGVPPLALRRLAQRLQSDHISRPSVHALLPEPGVSLSGSLAREHWNDAELYVQALQAARWIVALLQDRLTWQDRLESLTLAALLQDCGRLALKQLPQRIPTTEPEARQREARHPALGAAVLGNFVGLPADVPLLVGQHHERLDGSGFPRRLNGGQLGPEARLLTVVVRFVELLSEHDPADAAEGRAHRSAVGELVRETHRGKFDPAAVQWLLAALEPLTTDETRLPLDILTRTDPPHSVPGQHTALSNTTTAQRVGTPADMPAYRIRTRGGRRKVLIPYSPIESERNDLR
jgi:hypothetical protein